MTSRCRRGAVPRQQFDEFAQRKSSGEELCQLAKRYCYLTARAAAEAANAS